MNNDELYCTKHSRKKDCLGGASAHLSNWYCPECDSEKDELKRRTDINIWGAKKLGYSIQATSKIVHEIIIKRSDDRTPRRFNIYDKHSADAYKLGAVLDLAITPVTALDHVVKSSLWRVASFDRIKGFSHFENKDQHTALTKCIEAVKESEEEK